MTVSNASVIIYNTCLAKYNNETATPDYTSDEFHGYMVECWQSTIISNAVNGENELMSVRDYLVEKANANKRAAIAMSVLFVLFFFAFFYMIYRAYKNNRMLGQLTSNLPSSPRV